MPLGKIADVVLYTPFSRVYEVSERIHKLLTTDEFFNEKEGCFIKPDFDHQINRFNKFDIEDIKADDWLLYVDEMIDSLKSGKTSYEILKNWLKTNGDGVFVVLGDAGTGKTTFLHYLQWSKRKYDWHILDLKKSISEIDIISSSVKLTIEDFSSLHGKALSVLIIEMLNYLFVKNDNGNYNHIQNRKTLQFLLEQYENCIADATPLEEYAELYDNLGKVEFQIENPHRDRVYCIECAQIIAKYFNEKCCDLKRNRDKELRALKCALTHLLIIYKCLEKENSKKIVVVFDNIERFIGNDEIYNKELTDFLSDMRGISDQYWRNFVDHKTSINRFAKKYQFIISMRNTTVRNYTPAESIDVKRHIIDISNWFSIDEIIEAKLKWYEKKKIKVADETTINHLQYILQDLGITPNRTLNGLSPRLDLIFNYNKRMIIVFLLDLLTSENSISYFKIVDSFYKLEKNDNLLSGWLRFAYRSVIWRYVIDRLCIGDYFRHGIINIHTTLEGQVADLNYIWKLLNVLHKTSVDAGRSETESSGMSEYIPFLSLIGIVYNEHGDFSAHFYEDGYAKERERMARLLFYMNSYDPGDDNYFKFIDIQYNVTDVNGKFIKSWEDLLELFMKARENPEQLRIRITIAGKAYLKYISASFEFISSLAGQKPLLCCLPKEEELKNCDLKNLACLKIIHKTINAMQNYIIDAQQQANNQNLLYYRTSLAKGLTYTERLVNSTHGYLTNFSDCISRLVTVSDKTANKNKEKLIREIVKIADNLRKTYLI